MFDVSQENIFTWNNLLTQGENKASQAIQSLRTVPFFLLISLLYNYESCGDDAVLGCSQPPEEHWNRLFEL